MKSFKIVNILFAIVIIISVLQLLLVSPIMHEGMKGSSSSISFKKGSSSLFGSSSRFDVGSSLDSQQVHGCKYSSTNNKMGSFASHTPQYHDNLADFNAQGRGAFTLGVDGKLIQLSGSSNRSATSDTRYNTDSFDKYSSRNYVPNYEDSVYLSRLSYTNFDEFPHEPISAFYEDNRKNQGFCKINNTDTTKLEEKCNKLDKDVCASTECCVLLGGEKCVTGNDKGPIMKSNYNTAIDATLDKSYYIHKGGCYGNCS